jgi:hypothetical protein
MKHVLKDCGKHSGLKPGPCSKCNAPPKSKKYRQGLQAGGTPAIALIGEKIKPH